MTGPPIFDNTETPYMYMKRVNEYLRNLKLHDYKCIMNFVNEIDCIPNIKYKSLCEFKGVVFGANKNIVRKYGPQILKDLNLEGKFDFDKVNKNSISVFLSLVLEKIGYSLISKKTNEQVCYTIINHPIKCNKKYDKHKEQQVHDD